MKKKPLVSSAAAIGIFAIFGATQAIGKAQGSIYLCQQTKDKIEYYTNRRRSGGSPSTMESWKQSRDHYKDRFSDLNCSKWRNKLN